MSEKECPVGNTCEGCGYDGLPNCIDIMTEALHPKPDPVQSAEELAEKLRIIYEIGVDEGPVYCDQPSCQKAGAIQLLEADRADQRQAGREEAMRASDTVITKIRESYSAVVEALRALIAVAPKDDWLVRDARKALSDLDKGAIHE